MEKTKKINVKSFDIKSFLFNNAIVIILVGLGACVAATLLQKADYSGKFFPNLPEIPVIVALLITIGVCCIFGFANGCIISFFQVPPFIATLGMQTIVYGICLVYTGAVPLGGFRKEYTSIATGRAFAFGNMKGIPYLFFIALGIGLIMWFLYNMTRHGKYMYAIGGFLLAAKAGGATVNTGQGYELEAIAACTIGGVSTNGGVGKISGILIGVLVFEILKSSLQFLGVDTSWQYIVQGLVIVVAVALDLRKYLAKK